MEVSKQMQQQQSSLLLPMGEMRMTMMMMMMMMMTMMRIKVEPMLVRAQYHPLFWQSFFLGGSVRSIKHVVFLFF
jgi:hypothetical protein